MERKIVVVAPTYNEEENIENFLAAVLAQMAKMKEINWSVVVADSHSTDKTPLLVAKVSAKRKNVVYLDVKEMGLGLGLFKGIDYAFTKLGADTVITLEADLSADPKQFSSFVEKLSEGADYVIGSRYVDGGEIRNWSWWRKALSLGANLLLRILAIAPQVHEFTNLYRAFNKEVWTDIRENLLLQRGWLFVPAFTFEVLATNKKVVEIPMIFFDRYGGRSKMRTLSYAKNLLLYAIRFRLKKSESVFKFAVVGTIGFIVNTIVLVGGVNMGGLRPSTAGPVGAELAIFVGFALNNFWTFKEDRLKNWREFPFKFIQYNVIAFGSVVIQFLFLRFGEYIFGVTGIKSPLFNLPIVRFYSWYMFFYMLGVGVGMVWNYIMYRKIVWKKKNAPNP